MAQSSTDLIEKTIIGCIYTKPNLVDEIFVKEEYFNIPYNRLVFKLSCEFYKKNKNLDMILIYQEYQEYLTNNFMIYLTEAMDLISTTTIFDNYQEKLFEIYRNKLIIKCVNRFSKKEIGQEKLFDYLDKVKNMVSNKNYQFLSEEEIYKIISQENNQIKFRLETLSNLIKLSEHDLVVIGARPGVGKTGFALNLLEDISEHYQCLYFNMEMSEQQVLRRLVSINSNVPINNLMHPVTDYQASVVKNAVKDISKKKMKIFTGLQTTNSIKQVIIKETKKEHVVVFIDYVGLIAGHNNKSPYERITNIVKELRQISLNFDCTIICLAQVNRNGDDAPMLRDLKDSGELEQSAVSVMLLHNDNATKVIDKKVEEIDVMVAKNRNGRTGTIKVDYNQFNQRIEEKKKS